MAFGVASRLGTTCVIERDSALPTSAVAATTNELANAAVQMMPDHGAPPGTTKRGQTSTMAVVQARTCVRRSNTRSFMMAPSPRKTTLLSEELSREAGKVRTAAQESAFIGAYCTRFPERKQGFLRKEAASRR
jgi:hypothetical protein